MSKTRSHNTIRSQLISSINNSFSPGTSKFQDRKTGDYMKMTKIYSYAEKQALTDTAKDFSKWLKSSHPTIKMIKDINSTIIKEYLDSKTDSCTTHTIKALSNRLNKLSVLSSTMYNRKITWKVDKIPQGKETLRTIAMKENDYKAIIDVKSSAQGKVAVELAHAFGLRVSEIRIRPCDIKANSIVIYKSKGGKTRILPIETKEQRAIINKLKTISKENNTKYNKPILTIKPTSANKWLNDRCKKLGITTYNNHKTSFHSIRKNWAIREYKKELKNNDSKCAWSNVSEKLGHGRDREDLRKVYLPGIK